MYSKHEEFEAMKNRAAASAQSEEEDRSKAARRPSLHSPTRQEAVSAIDAERDRRNSGGTARRRSDSSAELVSSRNTDAA